MCSFSLLRQELDYLYHKILKRHLLLLFCVNIIFFKLRALNYLLWIPHIDRLIKYLTFFNIAVQRFTQLFQFLSCLRIKEPVELQLASKEINSVTWLELTGKTVPAGVKSSHSSTRGFDVFAGCYPRRFQFESPGNQSYSFLVCMINPLLHSTELSYNSVKLYRLLELLALYWLFSVVALTTIITVSQSILGSKYLPRILVKVTHLR